MAVPKPNWRLLKQRDLLTKYKPIADYGLIGDLKTCALIGIDGSIDWLCIPRFDSPSVFASILDKKKGGAFRTLPDYESFESRQYYEYLTNILVTEFKSRSGKARITDFMPCFKVENTMVSCGEIHRILRCTSGKFVFSIRFEPRMNYGRLRPIVERIKGVGYSFVSPDLDTRQELALITSRKLESPERGVLASTIRLQKGESVKLVLRYGGVKIHHKEATWTEIKLRETRAFWRDWVSKCTYEGKWKDMVLRSALVLKLLQYAPTNAIVAAATTSLPEEIGGIRNWDYRYSWIRDSSFVLWAFHELGHNEEALGYLDWVRSIFYLTGENIQVMLGINGERDLTETCLDHLSGYKSSKPVRVGNAAWDQFQLDVYGILLDALYFSHKHVKRINEKVYNYFVKQIVKAVISNWRKPDCGIWEVRGRREHFVYSKMWCWVAIDRAVKIAEWLGKEEDSQRWRVLRRKIRLEIMTKGWSKSKQSFRRAFGSDKLDAANLLMPQVRFLQATDPMMLSTIERTKAELLSKEKFLYRYLADDGLEGGEGAFLICSFWLVKCMALAGRGSEAERLMESLVKHANHLGLYSEEIDPNTGEMLGNFPQAFTHMGFITAAVSLSNNSTKTTDTLS